MHKNALRVQPSGEWKCNEVAATRRGDYHGQQAVDAERRQACREETAGVLSRRQSLLLLCLRDTYSGGPATAAAAAAAAPGVNVNISVCGDCDAQ